MADKTLTPAQKAYLVILMAEAREVSNSELSAKYGVSIVGDDSKELVAQKLVTRRQAKGFTHELTDPGWARCSEELFAEYQKVKNVAPAQAALHSLLGAVGRHLQRSDASLADFFAPTDAPPPPSRVAVRKKPVSDQTIVKRVRAAYKRLRPEPKAWVRLTDIRAELGDVSKEAVDAVLTKQAVERKIRLIPEEIQKSITVQDAAAAVRIGGEDKHLIMIEKL